MQTAHRSGRRLAHAALVVATAAALLLPGSGAHAAPARTATDLTAVLGRFPGFLAMPDSLALDAPVLLHGALADTTGRALADAEVLLSAWPSREARRALPERGEWQTVPVARTVAGSDGRFELRSVLTTLLGGLIGAQGLDLELHIFHGGRQYDWLSQVHPAADLRAWVTSLVDDVRLAPTRGAGPRNLLNIALDPDGGERLPEGLLGRRTVALGPPEKARHEELFPGHWCSTYKKFDTKVVRQIAAAAAARNGAVARVTYAEGASTTSSAGASINAGLSFEAAGDRSTTSTVNGDYAPLVSRPGEGLQNRYIVEIAHDISEQKCMTDFKGGYLLKYKTAPDRTVGTDHEDPKVATWRCKPKHAASVSRSIGTTTAKAFEYEKGFSFAPLGRAGFVGKSRSGYSTAVSVVVEFGGSGRGKWCGHSGFPTADGQMIQGYGL